MKKPLKIVGITALIIVGLGIAGIGLIIFRLFTAEPEIMTPPAYETNVSTGGDIEKDYLARGTHDVAKFTEAVDLEWKQYDVYYPDGPEAHSTTYPVIVMANGSGVWGSRYVASFEHYASWGFIVIGNEHNTAYAGDSSDASLEFLIEANKDPESELYQKVDLDNVGIIGHSQGGVGVFNAITSQPHGDMYTAAVSISPVSTETADTLNWTYQPGKVHIPTMVVAGTDDDVISLSDLQSVYKELDAPKAMGLRSDTNHPEMLYSADGYATAWMMWHLQNDDKAMPAFVGKEPEMLTNPNWQDVTIDAE